MSYLNFTFVEDRYVNVAFILEDNTIFHDIMEENGLDNVSMIDTKKVLGYVVVEKFEDADEDDILDAFKYGFNDIEEYFEDLKDHEKCIKDPYTYYGVSRSDFF